MKSLLFLLAAFINTLAFGDGSDPAGAFRILLRGNSDTIVSLPLHRPPLVETSIQTRTGNQLELAADIPALPPGGAYVLIMTGTLEGAVLPVTSLSGRNLTVDPDAYDLSALKTETISGLAEGDLAAVIPHWTLDTVFPGGQGVNASASVLVRATEVLCYDSTSTGTDFSASTRYFYLRGHASKPDGWYKVGDTNTLCGSHRLPPLEYFIVRHNTAVSSEVLLCGGIQLSRFSLPVRLRTANVAQDNLAALPTPLPLALEDSGLVTSNAFTPSTSVLNRADELLVFDNTLVGQQKAPSVRFFYFAGNASRSAGWYKVGDTGQTVNPVLLPGEGFIVRKRASSVLSTDFWQALPAYLQ